MIKFDAVNFSERRSEEVISFFWRSVYLILQEDMRSSSITHIYAFGKAKAMYCKKCRNLIKTHCAIAEAWKTNANAWANQMSVNITLEPDHVFVQTW